MNGKQAKRIRKLLNLTKEELEGSSKKQSGIKRVGIIDGETGELSERLDETYTQLASPMRGVYQTLKQAFKNKEDPLHAELTVDLKNNRR